MLHYIADFMCLDLKLVIEVDGLTHQWEETQRKDNEKDAALKAAGFTVLRFTDDEILKKMSWVKERIEIEIEKIEKHHLRPADGGGTPPPAEDK